MTYYNEHFSFLKQGFDLVENQPTFFTVPTSSGSHNQYKLYPKESEFFDREFPDFSFCFYCIITQKRRMYKLRFQHKEINYVLRTVAYYFEPNKHYPAVWVPEKFLEMQPEISSVCSSFISKVVNLNENRLIVLTSSNDII